MEWAWILNFYLKKIIFFLPLWYCYFFSLSNLFLIEGAAKPAIHALRLPASFSNSFNLYTILHLLFYIYFYVIYNLYVKILYGKWKWCWMDNKILLNSWLTQFEVDTFHFVTMHGFSCVMCASPVTAFYSYLLRVISNKSETLLRACIYIIYFCKQIYK